jgi:sphingomyelin phosphodiesterase acid-like 3
MENNMIGHSKKGGESPDNSDSTKPGGGITRRDFVKYSAGTVACIYLGALNTGCGGGTTTSSNFPVVVFSDVHFNPFYDPTLFSALVAADAGDWATVFKTSSITAPSSRGGDTNYPLLMLALSSIRQNLGASPLIIFTGDILGHGLPQMFYLHLNGTKNPRDLADVAAMKAFTDKVVAFLMDQVRSSVGNIPVMFAVGNGDSYSGYGPNVLDSSLSPDNSFLVNTADLFYTKFLNGTVDHQGFLNTFTIGGYYSAEPAGTNLMVIGLNTILFCQLFSSGPTANDSIVAAELDWLDSRLAAAEVKGKKVWLLMHAPPGADIGTTAKPANVDSSGHIATASMMWWPAYQARFLAILSNYPGLISLTLAGHTHMDEYRILPSADALEITPSISPWFGNNPAYKVFTLSRDTLKPTDYSSLNYDLATNPVQFNSYYTFSTAYSSQGLLDASLTQLTPALVTDSAKQALYRGHYYSGNNSLTPVTYPYGNPYSPITNTTWPVYWCGIGKIEQQDFFNSVNSYPA